MDDRNDQAELIGSTIPDSGQVGNYSWSEPGGIGVTVVLKDDVPIAAFFGKAEHRRLRATTAIETDQALGVD